MRHRKSGRKLGMDSTARKAMFRNMVTSLLEHGQIKTTVHRAKELRRHAERIITLGKNAPSVDSLEGLSGEELEAAKASRVHAIRRVRQWVRTDDAVDKVFGEYAERFQTRPGGYTRIIRAGFREGDRAAMAYISFVDALGTESAEATEA